MKRIGLWILVALVGVAAALGWWKTWQLGQALEEAERAETRADSLALEVVAERARADAWATGYGVATKNLHERFAARHAQLAEDLEAARARVRVSAQLVARAEARVQSLADTVEVMRQEDGEDVVEYRGTVDDGLLWARWRFRLPATSLHLDPYRLRVEQELDVAQTGSNQLLVLARATDPRVELVLDSVLVDPRPPEVVHRISWEQATAAAGAGVLLAAILFLVGG